MLVECSAALTHYVSARQTDKENEDGYECESNAYSELTESFARPAPSWRIVFPIIAARANGMRWCWPAATRLRFRICRSRGESGGGWRNGLCAPTSLSVSAARRAAK